MSRFTTARPVANVAILVAALSVPVALQAQAGEDSQQPAGQRTLNRAQMATQLDANFKAADSNGDKALSLAEIEAAQKVQLAQASASMPGSIPTRTAS